MSQSNTEYNHHSFKLRINSKDRISGTHTDFTCGIGGEIRQHNIKRMVLHSVNIMNSDNNINSYASKLRVETGVDGVLNIVLTEGQYTITTLITALETAINALATNTVTITLDSLTSILTFSIDGGDTIGLFANDSNNNSNMSPVLGIIEDKSLSASVLCDRIVRLNGLTQLFLQSDRLSSMGFHDTSKESKNYFASIQVPVDYGQFLYWESDHSNLSNIDFVTHRKIDSVIDIKVLDQNENILDTKQDIDIQFTVYYIP